MFCSLIHGVDVEKTIWPRSVGEVGPCWRCRADAQWQLDPCIAGELLGGVDLCLLGNTQAAAALPLAALLQMKEKLVQVRA